MRRFNDCSWIILICTSVTALIKVPIEEVVWTMHNLIQHGKILYWGTSEWSGVEIMEAHRVAQEYKLIGPS